MKLYFSPGACSLSPHIVLEETGLPYTLVKASTKTHQLDDGTDFYTINPLGYVPVLELADGRRLFEGPAIVQYLADQAPEKHLAPANGTFERYRLQGWLNFVGTEVHKSFGPLFNPKSSDEVKANAKAYISKRLAWVDSELAQRPYLNGDAVSVADFYLFVVTNWAKPVGLDIAGLTHLNAFRDRIANRPAVQAAMRQEGLLG
ncbi:glutathione transferase GstA [Comamonas serinivorans]|uniref:Glutathione transferase GstA n=1 Tax=Comamonas serinivorans TaxID=1082851 RepID=A0A1Y0EIZ1_9BURK|nr:glutathione transferase GstA [Comamonas serinivorans]ARU03381.1 glutathione transferase GstA [Comamonas serinivorans]